MNSNIDLLELNQIFDFEYFETYSLLRGSEYEKTVLEQEKLYCKLSEKLKSNSLNVEENQKLNHLDSQLNYVQFLFDENQKLHNSAEKLKRFYSNENEAKKLINIFKTKTKNIPSWMCAPIYRDAIVFYNKENVIIEVLNFCFSCEYIQNANKRFIDADENVYKNLAKLLQEFGHKISSED